MKFLTLLLLRLLLYLHDQPNLMLTGSGERRGAGGHVAEAEGHRGEEDAGARKDQGAAGETSGTDFEASSLVYFTTTISY